VKSLLTIGLAFVVGCASQLVGPNFERFEFNKTPSPSDYPDAPSVILLDRGTLSFSYDTEKQVPVARLRRYQRIKLFQKTEQSSGSIMIPFDPGTIITDVIARSIHPDGSTYQLSDHVQEVAHPTGVKAKAFVIPGAVSGSVIEYAYDHYFHDLRFIPPWFFTADAPNLRSEFAVVLPKGYDINYRYYEGGIQKTKNPERFDVDGRTRLFWYASNQARLYREPRMASSYLLSPQLRLSFVSASVGGKKYQGFSSWDDVKTWFEAAAGEWSRLDAAQIDEANRIAGDTSDEEKALKLLTIISRDLKKTPGPPLPVYLTWIPSANTTLNNGIGNASSRGLLLTALMRAVGLDADLGLVAYNDRSSLYPDFPDAQALDGVITVLSTADKKLFFDPSQLTVSTEVPSTRLQNARVVVLRKEHAEVVRVPKSKSKDSTTQVRYTLKTSRNGDVSGSVEIRLIGSEAGELRTALLATAPDQYPKIISDFIATRGAAIPLDNTTITDLKDLRRPLTISGQVQSRIQLGENEDTQVYLDTRQIIGVKRGKMREVRRYPFMLGVPRTAEVYATISFPSDHRLKLEAETQTAKWAHGTTTLEVRQETQTRIRFKRTETIDDSIVVQKDYRRLLGYLQSQDQLEELNIEVGRPAPKAIGY